MATYTGQVVAVEEGSLRSPNWSDNFDGRTLPRWEQFGIYDDSEETVLPGGFSSGFPYPMPGNTYSGTRARTFFEDAYNQIYFIPGHVDFGAVVADKSQAVTIINRYLDPITLSTVSVDHSEGVSLSGPDTPYTFPPLGSTVYTVTAFEDGPAAIESTFTFQFQVAGNYRLSVSGTRAQLWPFVPNWSESYKIGYEFKSDILTSYSGKEQRRALRQTPRRTLNHKSLIRSAVQLRQFKRLMNTWAHRLWVFPERTRSVNVTVGMPSQGLTLTVDDAPWWLTGSRTVVLEYRGVQELRTIDAVSGDQVTFTSGTTTMWPKGTVIYPGWSGHLAVDIKATRQTDCVAEVDVSFSEDPGLLPPRPLDDPAQTLAGREIFLLRHNWKDELDASTTHPVDLLDFGYGRTARFTPIDFTTTRIGANYTGRDRDQMDRLLETFLRNLGQQGEVYMPTWEDDMTLAAPIQTSTATLRVKGQDVYNGYSGDTVHKAICLVMTDGTFLFQQVAGMAPVDDEQGSDTILTVPVAWTSDIPLAAVKTICWMPVWRFASDGLTIEWLTDTVAQTKVNWQTLEDLPEDVLE